MRCDAEPTELRRRGHPHREITTPLLLVLALLSAVGPFATDLYLPAFPEMTGDLHTSATAVQLTPDGIPAGCDTGTAGLRPTVRPLRPREAAPRRRRAVRRRGCCRRTRPNVGILVAARFAQGLGGAAGMVIGRAIISDLSTGKRAAQAFSLMMIVGGVAPVIAPMVGGFLVGPIGWRGILVVVLAISVVMLIAVAGVVRETLPREKRDAHAAEDDAQSAWTTLRNPAFLGYCCAFDSPSRR